MINKYVSIDSRVCNGKPVLAGTRIPVTVILDQLAESGSMGAVLHKFPELSRDQIEGVLQYCSTMIERTDLDFELV